MKVLTEAIDEYLRNIMWISIFSLSFLIAFPISSFLPSFISLGATFLRFGSIPTDLSITDLTIMSILFLISLFLISFAVVGINLIIKARKTITSIKTEVLNRINDYVLNVFWMYLIATVFSLFFDIFFLEKGLHETFGMASSFVIWLLAFFYPNALIIDDMPPSQAIKQSVSTLSRSFLYVLLWLFIGSVLVLISSFLSIYIYPLLSLLINSIFIMPFLIVLQTKIYMSKYHILG